MAHSSRSTPTYFLVPDEKIKYDDFVQLGNVLYRIAEPDNVLSQPRLSIPAKPLGIDTSTKELQNYSISSKSSNASKVGFFSKVLDLLGVGLNASRTGSKTESEAYTVASMSISTFTPPKEFLKVVEKDTAISQWLQNSAEKSAFLITGVVVATGVKFTSSADQEKGLKGSVGIGGHGVKFGPSGSKSRKNVLDVSYTDDGPVVLAYRVQKLLLTEAGKLDAKPFTDGAYFGDGDPLIYDLKVDGLDEDDVEGFQRVMVVNEIDGEECGLYFPV